MQQPTENNLPRVTATIINGMRPQTIGRALGIGMRVAGRVVGQRLAESAQAATSSQAAANPQTRPIPNSAVKTSAQATTRPRIQAGGVAKGVGGFLRPFGRVGRIVWLEVTGVFFLLPVLAFTPNLWRMRASWAHGADHNMFLITAGVVLLFLYLGITSFWRARRKERQK
jgi:hypothetical protein